MTTKADELTSALLSAVQDPRLRAWIRGRALRISHTVNMGIQIAEMMDAGTGLAARGRSEVAPGAGSWAIVLGHDIRGLPSYLVPSNHVMQGIEGVGISTLREASNALKTFVDVTGTGGSAMAREAGAVVSPDGMVPYYVSYNGRVWHTPPGTTLARIRERGWAGDTSKQGDVTGAALDAPLPRTAPRSGASSCEERSGGVCEVQGGAAPSRAQALRDMAKASVRATNAAVLEVTPAPFTPVPSTNLAVQAAIRSFFGDNMDGTPRSIAGWINRLKLLDAEITQEEVRDGLEVVGDYNGPTGSWRDRRGFDVNNARGTERGALADKHGKQSPAWWSEKEDMLRRWFSEDMADLVARNATAEAIPGDTSLLWRKKSRDVWQVDAPGGVRYTIMPAGGGVRLSIYVGTTDESDRTAIYFASASGAKGAAKRDYAKRLAGGMRTNPRRRNPDGGSPGHHATTIPTEVIFDSEGRKYPAVYRVVATALDGSGPVVTSHSPRDMDWTPGYPPEFQTRDLGAPEESAKINTIAQTLDPIRLLGKNMDPTLGPPVSWDSGDERYYVLGGNGRTIAFLRASDAKYTSYLAEARRRWNCFPNGDAPHGCRWLLIRSIAGISKAEAIQLAAASQLSTAADESRIGKALGLIRSLSLNVDNLPPIKWTDPVAADNMGEFADQNGAFVNALLRGMDPAKRARYQGDMDALAGVVSQVFVGFLPPSVRKPGMFEDPKVEDALLGAIPGIVTTAGLARGGEVYPEYDLLAALTAAVDVFATMRRLRLSYARFQAHLEGEMRSQPIAGVPRLSDAPPVALALAAALFRAARAAAPEITISTTLRQYIQAIEENAGAPGGSPNRPALFGGAAQPGDPRRPDPGVLLASFVPGFQLPQAAPVGGMFGARNNPRENPPSTILRRLTRAALKLAYPAGRTPPFAWWEALNELNLSRFKQINPAFYWHVIQGARKELIEDGEAVVVLHAAMLEQLPDGVRYLADRAPASVQANIVTLLPAVLSGHYDAQASGARRDPVRELEAALSGSSWGPWSRSTTEALAAILPASRTSAAEGRQRGLFGNPRGSRNRRRR